MRCICFPSTEGRVLVVASRMLKQQRASRRACSRSRWPRWRGGHKTTPGAQGIWQCLDSLKTSAECLPQLYPNTRFIQLFSSFPGRPVGWLERADGKGGPPQHRVVPATWGHALADDWVSLGKCFSCPQQYSCVGDFTVSWGFSQPFQWLSVKLRTSYQPWIMPDLRFVSGAFCCCCWILAFFFFNQFLPIFLQACARVT